MVGCSGVSDRRAQGSGCFSLLSEPLAVERESFVSESVVGIDPGWKRTGNRFAERDCHDTSREMSVDFLAKSFISQVDIPATNQ